MSPSIATYDGKGGQFSMSPGGQKYVSLDTEATHNYERTHRDSVKASLGLLKAYLLSRLAE